MPAVGLLRRENNGVGGGMGDFPEGVGNWQLNSTAVVNTSSFPDGLKPISDAAHAANLSFVLWFEPERVTLMGKGTKWNSPTYIEEHHPEWLAPDTNGSAGGDLLTWPHSALFDLSQDDAKLYAQQCAENAVDAYGLDCYRVDFNLIPGPLPSWRAADAAKHWQPGTTEAKYIENLYSYWDAMVASSHMRGKDLYIDACASGGRRIDIEMLSRGVIQWRSDYGNPDPVAHQVHTMGLVNFAPFSSGPVFDIDPYHWRSSGAAGKVITWGPIFFRHLLAPENATRLAMAKAAVEESKSLRMWTEVGDYYNITEVSLEDESWAGYQFHSEAADAGFAYIFRRSSAQASFTAKLHLSPPSRSMGLQGGGSDAGVGMYNLELHANSYRMTSTTVMDGATLMSGFEVKLPHVNSSLLLRYSRHISE
jgi:alpha-galactosidase